jgi:hypothetical protein
MRLVMRVIVALALLPVAVVFGAVGGLWCWCGAVCNGSK